MCWQSALMSAIHLHAFCNWGTWSSWFPAGSILDSVFAKYLYHFEFLFQICEVLARLWFAIFTSLSQLSPVTADWQSNLLLFYFLLDPLKSLWRPELTASGCRPCLHLKKNNNFKGDKITSSSHTAAIILVVLQCPSTVFPRQSVALC